LNTDACVQVAHAISTHKVYNEYDYFTAVDDCSPEDNAGAGHIGTVEFNSSTLYRYATVAVHALRQQVGCDTTEAVCGFVRAFTCSMPTGKQNTFANRTLPDIVLVTLRRDQPVNLVGAFEKPIPPGDNGYVKASIQRLAAYEKGVYNDFAQAPALTLASGQGSGKWELMPFNALIDTLADELNALLLNDGEEQ
jgi:CRISPR system Cascade subunit CasC